LPQVRQHLAANTISLEQHPVVQWINDKVTSSFRRQQAPVITLEENLAEGETVFIMSGLIPNRKGIHLFINGSVWYSVMARSKKYSLWKMCLSERQLGKKEYPNRKRELKTEALKSMMPIAVKNARLWISQRRKEFEESINPKT